MSHTKQALARGYTLLAMEPNDEKGLCWSSTNKNGYVNDQPDVRRAAGPDAAPKQGPLAGCLAWRRRRFQRVLRNGRLAAQAPLSLASAVSKPQADSQARTTLRLRPCPLPAQAIAAITKFLLDQGLASKPVYLAGASSGGTFALKLPATLYLAAKSAGALSLEQAAAMAEAFNGTAASVPDLAGALAAAASAGGMVGVGQDAAGRVNATAAPFYLQVQGIITGGCGWGEGEGNRLHVAWKQAWQASRHVQSGACDLQHM